MKIILCNKFFFLNGGTERYLQNVMGELDRAGHHAVPFSVRYSGSWSSPFDGYFMPPPGSAEQVHFKNIRLGAGNIIRHLDRGIYSVEARMKLDRLLDHVGGADIGYILNVYNYMSLSIVDSFRRRRIPVVLRLGDYHLLCPSYLFLRKGRVCTLCLRGNYLHGLIHRCVKGSIAASAVRVFAMFFQKWVGLYDRIDAFIVPCRFMGEKLVEGGIPGDRVHVIRTPVEEGAVPPAASRKGSYMVYFGRISYEKGLDTLLEAYRRMSPALDLVLLGRSYDGEEERLRKLIRPEHRDKIKFLGFKEGEELSRWVAGALFSVVPSRWFDNTPVSVYESLLQGTPVLASRIGGIPEQVEEGVTGRLFDPDSVEGLMEGLGWMLADRDRLEEMGRRGREAALTLCGMRDHMNALITLFQSLRDRHV